MVGAAATAQRRAQRAGGGRGAHSGPVGVQRWARGSATAANRGGVHRRQRRKGRRRAAIAGLLSSGLMSRSMETRTAELVDVLAELGVEGGRGYGTATAAVALGQRIWRRKERGRASGASGEWPGGRHGSALSSPRPLQRQVAISGGGGRAAAMARVTRRREQVGWGLAVVSRRSPTSLSLSPFMFSIFFI